MIGIFQDQKYDMLLIAWLERLGILVWLVIVIILVRTHNHYSLISWAFLGA
jgi:hypothetical protein